MPNVESIRKVVITGFSIGGTTESFALNDGSASRNLKFAFQLAAAGSSIVASSTSFGTVINGATTGVAIKANLGAATVGVANFIKDIQDGKNTFTKVGDVISIAGNVLGAAGANKKSVKLAA